MKTNIATVIGVGLLAFAGTAFAGPWGYGGGMVAQGTPVSVEAVKKFQDETTTLRNEMMLKKVELRNEYLKQPVDAGRVATLTKEMTDLQAKITTIATSNGLPGPGGGGCGMGCGMGMGRGMGRMQAAYQNR
ncbi:hypothetical protein [Geobacter sp. SVR]|uniref:hypothetical protein n=1 Tax=Geobacter sp. SVR TaxID=2495594 RepID=UPI00143EFB52|nr:hypothetical protein [Geobacter sp. SVR]BCS51912.1 hypothetical protein GSVR_02200 [Geobacter sp. SVR]BCS51924.1 hypothetical protein GSVR_02320 [Geobacter sp. SVR]BCS51936.1 hypothetical protein GSVR_02440 [Geobacter sp. SVR]BCS51948.1 hypothetical protein GSVR_02560 [Geobacter sp. SVR]GCF87750.1 hypothetical protein GSbR_43500 [Geobacter sp. SVR]